MKDRRRTVLHVDLDPFFISVERGIDPTLRARPLVVGGDGHGLGFVAAASTEARTAGVHVGMPLSQARRVCPDAAFVRGDLEAYGRASEEVTAVLLAASPRVERPSADEAFVDLTPEAGDTPPMRAAETIRGELQRRLGFDASLGLAGSRLAARIASAWARPRGLLAVLPGYELSFLAGKPVSTLGLSAPLESALAHAGLLTLGGIAESSEAALAAIVGPGAARIFAAARGEDDSPIALAAPPASILEEARVRDRESDRDVLQNVVDGLARRAARRLRPLRLCAGALSVEARRADEGLRRAQPLRPPVSDEETIAVAAGLLAADLLVSVEGIRSLHVRLSRLESPSSQTPLFPVTPALRRAR